MLSPSVTTTPTMTDPLGAKIADLYQGENARGSNEPSRTGAAAAAAATIPARTSPTRLAQALRRGSNGNNNSNERRRGSNSNLNGLGLRNRSSTVGAAGTNASANSGQLGRTERERSQMLRSISHLTKTQRPPTAPNEEEQMEWLNAPAGLSTAHVVSPPLVIPPPPEYDWREDGHEHEHESSSHAPSSFLQRRNRSRSVGNFGEQADQAPFLRRSFSRSRSNFRAWASSSTANLTSPSVVSLHGGTSTPTTVSNGRRKGSIPQLGRLAAAFRSRESLFSSKGSSATAAAAAAPPPLPLPPGGGRRRPSETETIHGTGSEWPGNLNLDANLREAAAAAGLRSRVVGNDDVDHRAAGGDRASGTWPVDEGADEDHDAHAQSASAAARRGEAPRASSCSSPSQAQHHCDSGRARAARLNDEDARAHEHWHEQEHQPTRPLALPHTDPSRGDGAESDDGRPTSASAAMAATGMTLPTAPPPQAQPHLIENSPRPTASRSSSSSTLPSSQQHSNSWTTHAGDSAPPPHTHAQSHAAHAPIASILATSQTHPRNRTSNAGHSRQQSVASTASSFEASPTATSHAARSSFSLALASPLAFHDTPAFRSPPRISFDLPAFAAYDTANNSRAASRRPSVARLAMDTTPVREDPSELAPTMAPAAADLARDPSTSGVSFADTSASAVTDSSNGHGGSGSIIDHGSHHRLSHPNTPGIPAYPAASSPTRYSTRRVSVAPSADDSTASIPLADGRRRSSGIKLSKLKQWASRSSTNLAPPSPLPSSSLSSARKSMDVRASPALPASPASASRKSISFFRPKDPRPDDAGLSRFRRSSFMKSRTSMAPGDGTDGNVDPETMPSDAERRRKSSLPGGPGASGWLGKVFRGASASSTPRRTSMQNTRTDSTTPSTRETAMTAPSSAMSSTMPSPLPSSEEAQRTFDYAFGPVQTTEGTGPSHHDGARQQTATAGLPPSSHQAMPFSFKADATGSPVTHAARDHSQTQDEVGPMGEPLTPPEEGRQQAPHHLHTGPFFSNDTRSSISSANHSHSTSPSSAQTQQTNLTVPASKPTTPAAAALPGSALVHSITDDDLRSDMSRTVSEDELTSDALIADEFVDAVEMPPSDSAGAISAITATEGSQSSVADGDNDEGAPSHDRLSTLPASAGSSSAADPLSASRSTDPPRRPARTRSHLSHLPRLNSQRVLHRAEGGQGSDGEDETSRDSNNDRASGGSGGSGGGAGGGGRRNGSGDAHESEDGSETETADEDEESETDTDGEDDHEQEQEHDHEQAASAHPGGSEQEVAVPGAFAVPEHQTNAAASRMALSFSRERSNRPGDIALPPAPTFTAPSKTTTQDTQAGPASARPGPWQSSAESPAAAAATTRASWMQFTETPFETPTPMASGAGGVNGQASLASASKTPSVSSHASQEPSYFSVRPAAPRNAANVQGSNMPPPSPSVITRNRAPSSSSVRTARIVPTPGRELPPVPPIQPQHLKALAAANQQSKSSAAAGASTASAQPVSPALSPSRDRPATAVADVLSPARGPRTPTSLSGNSNARDSSVERLGASNASIGATNGYRPGLYHQASRSLIDLPSAARQRESFHEPHGLPPPTPQQEQVPGTPDFAARPPPTPKSGLMPELVTPTSTLNAPTMQRRRSMIEIAAVPPPYAIIHRRPEGPQMIYPREEEGREKLPAYGCSVHIEGYLPRKMEFSSPSVQARDRSWKRCYFVLHGTCLKVFRNDLSGGPRPNWGTMKGQHVHPEPINEDGSNGGAGSTPGANLIEAMSHTSLPFGRGDDSKGAVLREYTLQGAESGLAADYLKRRHVVRVRAEGEQFLLQTTNDRHLVDWIECLQAGTNIAADLEVRQMPKFITLPRRRRRRRPREAEAQEQADLAEAQRRSLADGGGGRGGAGSVGNSRTSAGRNSVSGAAGATTPDPSARFDEMLREEHEQMGRTTGTDAVI